MKNSTIRNLTRNYLAINNTHVRRRLRNHTERLSWSESMRSRNINKWMRRSWKKQDYFIFWSSGSLWWWWWLRWIKPRVTDEISGFHGDENNGMLRCAVFYPATRSNIAEGNHLQQKEMIGPRIRDCIAKSSSDVTLLRNRRLSVPPTSSFCWNTSCISGTKFLASRWENLSPIRQLRDFIAHVTKRPRMVTWKGSGHNLV